MVFGSFGVVGDDYQYWHCKHQKFDRTYFYIQNESSKNFENDQYYLEEPPKIFGSRGFKIFFINELDNNFNSTHSLESAYIQDSRNELRISISEEVFDWKVPPLGRMKKVETDLDINLEDKYLDLVDRGPNERTELKCSNLTEKIFEAAYSSFTNKHEKELLE
jgi:hypothetical protein